MVVTSLHEPITLFCFDHAEFAFVIIICANVAHSELSEICDAIVQNLRTCSYH